jgi:DNA primase
MINEIKSRLGILELVAKLGLKVTNGNFVHSIYKSERTPSLKLYPETNSFYCFATNKGGDLIKFWADARKISNGEAIKELSQMLGLGNDFHLRKTENHFPEVPAIKKEKEIVLLESEREIFEERSSIIQFEANKTKEEAERLALDFILQKREEVQTKIYESLYQFCLKNPDEQALSYLKNERCLTNDSIENFKLFTIGDVQKTIEFLRSNFSKDELKVSGLFTEKNFFIFSHHQIVVPYIQGGQIKYLRARYFNKGNSKPENNFGKYIGLSNSFAGNLGSRRFFNFDALKKLVPNEKLFIFEGEFDVMLAAQFGFNSIGIAGVGNFPKDEGTISLLKNFDLFLFFDSDEAGQKAVEEISKLFEGKKIHSIKLKNYKDFTELVRNGKYKL